MDAVHGRLLTARSTAGVLGPLIVDRVADRQEEAGRHGPSLYGPSLLIVTGLLVAGFVAQRAGAARPPPPPRPRPRDAEGGRR